MWSGLKYNSYTQPGNRAALALRSSYLTLAKILGIWDRASVGKKFMCTLTFLLPLHTTSNIKRR